MVLKLFTTFIVVAAILASPKHRDFTWSYRSSIYRVHWVGSSGTIGSTGTIGSIGSSGTIARFTGTMGTI